MGTPLQLLTPSGKPRWLADPDESGLYYHRYYDREQGRYISQDPIGGTNLYGYVTNPIGMVSLPSRK
nr:RHS repeat-associated core domain-containing protein [Halomonas llamarensis]